MPSCDAASFNPPAPIAAVTLRSWNRDAFLSNVVLLIDTGADATLLPRLEVERIGVHPVPDLQYELTAFDGTKSLALVADLDMLFLNRAFRGRYLLIEAEQGVLGRDVLNHVTLLVDGPNQQWYEHVS